MTAMALVRRTKKERVTRLFHLVSGYLTIKSKFNVFWNHLSSIKEKIRRNNASKFMAYMFVILYKRMCNLKLVHRAMYGNEDKCPPHVDLEMRRRLSTKKRLAEVEDKREPKKLLTKSSEIPKEGIIT